MRNKKIITMLAALALVGVVGAGSTLAYLTDSDKAVNTFTVGNVSIELIESQLHRSNASGAEGQDTASKANLMVAADEYSNAHGWNGKYYDDQTIKDDAAEDFAAYFKEASKNLVPGRSVRKYPYVINNGYNSAYVRVRAYVPYELDPNDDGIIGGQSYWCSTAWRAGEFTINGVAANDENAYDTLVKNIKKVTIDGVDYSEFTFVYQKALEPGEMTFWHTWGTIEIDPDATAEDLKDFSEFNVIFEADAIQAEGFADAATAFAAFDK